MVSVRIRAPVRIDFAGGWSDVPDFAQPEGGCVVNAAISLYAHVECILGGGVIRLNAEDVGVRQLIRNPAEIVYDGTLDLHKAALNMLPVSGGVEILSRSDVPAGSGLGASGSLDVALLAALARCREETYDVAELAEMAFLLETSELKLAGGRQDQYAAALGGLLEMTFGAGAGAETRPLELAADAVRDLEAHLAVVYTGESHFSSATHDRVWSAFHDGNGVTSSAIGTMRDLAQAAGSAIEAADWKELARIVDANWEQQQRLDGTIRTERTQSIERAVRDAGAWGFKATGAGAGGCVLVVASPTRRAEVVTAAESAGGRILDWRFDFDGVTGEAAEP